MNIPRPEYPRPQFTRERWMNLNGQWDFLFDFGNSGVERALNSYENFSACSPREITVPFCPESKLSGIGYTDWMAAVWYSRKFTLTEADCAERTLIHFGAVDYHSVVFINGERAGEHTGGYSSFEFDITAYVRAGENRVTVYAEDDPRSGRQPVGKQSDRYYSHDCSYTRTTGIWQTVWLEFVPFEYIKSVKLTPFAADSVIRVEAKTSGGAVLRAEAFYKGEKVGEHSGTVVYGSAAFDIHLSELHLWDVGKPELYNLTLTLDSGDRAESYFGMRSVELRENALYLNGRPLFMRTILDQGFNPEGIYTAPSDDFLRRDITLAMELGFNGARFHQRVFEQRSLYWADRLGYIVWGEYANDSYAADGRGIGYFLPEWMETVERDYSHPAIIGWCPENESYWRHDIDGICQRTFYAVTKQMDPYRPVIDASGGLHFITDMFDVHEYEQNPDALRAKLAPMLEDKDVIHNPLHNNVLARQKYEGQPYWISEYGGTFWNPDTEKSGWGYGGAPADEEEFAERFAGLTSVLLRCPRVCGFCYTQLTDVEQECNGLYRYDRSRKFSDAVYDRIREANIQTAAVEDSVSDKI